MLKTCYLLAVFLILAACPAKAANIILTNNSIVVGPGSANRLVGTFRTVGLGNPRLLLDGPDACKFVINGAQLFVGPQDLIVTSYPASFNFRVWAVTP